MGKNHPVGFNHGKLIETKTKSTMPFAIIAYDKSGASVLRAQLREAHLKYLSERQDIMLAGGAMLDEAGLPIGGLIILNTEDRLAAENFAAGDPFRTGGVFDTVQVIPWRKSFFDFQRCA
jgi:uncharacterized protein YciI